MNNYISKPNSIVLHLGAHKTGTSLIQNWLYINKVTLLQNGIGSSIPRDVAGSEFDALCFELSKPRPRSTLAARAEASIFDMWTKSGRPTIYIISKENILGESGRMYVNTHLVTTELKLILRELEVYILFYVRRNDHFIESHVLQQYAHGNEVCVDDVLNSMNDRGWASVIESMESDFPGRVRVNFYEKIHRGTNKYIENFCAAFNADISNISNLQIPPISEQNRSLSDDGLTLLRRKWESTDPSCRVALYDSIRAAHNTGTGSRPSLLSSAQRQEIVSRFRDENVRIIQKYSDGEEDLLRFYSIADDTFYS